MKFWAIQNLVILLGVSCATCTPRASPSRIEWKDIAVANVIDCKVVASALFNDSAIEDLQEH